jgi:hypothetical protein
METQWLDGVKQLNVKMKALQTLLRDYGRDATHTAQDELFMLLASGVPSTALAQFFTQNISEVGLTRLQKAVDAACVNMQKLGYEQIQQSVEALVFRLSEMRGLARWREKYAAIGLDEAAVDGFLHAAEGTMFKVEELLVAVHEAQSNFNGFFAWLLQTSSMLERQAHQEDGTAASRAGTTQTATEVMRIAAFLRQAVAPAAQQGGAGATHDEGSGSAGSASTFDDLLQVLNVHHTHCTLYSLYTVLTVHHTHCTHLRRLAAVPCPAILPRRAPPCDPPRYWRATARDVTGSIQWGG